MTSNRAVAFLWLSLVVLSIAAPAPTQCTTHWLPGDGVAGTDGIIWATAVWDRDGAGPIPPVLVVGGSFSLMASVPVRNLAVYDPATGSWSELGGGTEGAVTCFATLPTGELFVGGYFSWVGTGLYANCVARWTGSAWSATGSNGFRSVYSLLALPNGDVLAGGRGDQQSDGRVERWNGAYWTQLGSGMWGGSYVPFVRTLARLANGDIVAAGYFTSAGSAQANCIARWNGVAWGPLGSGVSGSFFSPTPVVNALTVLANGDLLAGGNFTAAGGVAAHGIARWDGTSWSSVGSGWSATVSALLTLPNGDAVAGGYTGIGAYNVASWDGTSWTALGVGVSKLPLVSNAAPCVFALARLPNDDLVAGGDFAMAGSAAATGIARWNGASWSGLSAGSNGSLRAVVALPNGDVVAGGDFTSVGGVIANRIARWDGNTWSTLGSGMNGTSLTQAPSVNAIITMPNGDIVAGGDFITAGSVAATRVARWDGTSWAPLASGMNDSVKALARLPNGDVLAGGDFTNAGGASANGIARWDGSSWTALGVGVSRSPTTLVPPGVYALAVLSNGDVLAGGCFTRAGGLIAEYIARWDGTSWFPVSSGMSGPMTFFTRPGVFALAPLSNGDVAVGGWFTSVGGVAADRIARWNGTNWSPFGTGIYAISLGDTAKVSTIAVLPDGDLIAGGNFVGYGGSPSNIARWNGTNWSSVETGLNKAVHGLTMLPNGDLVASGAFSRTGDPYTSAGALAAAGLARLTTTCPATVMPFGIGCIGAGGANVLTAATLPWMGSTYTATATGLAPQGLAVEVHGFATLAVPLSNLLPQGTPGCMLLVAPDSLSLLLPIAGGVQATILLPNSTSLAGLVFHQQLVSIEADGFGDITALTSSNALTLTIGIF